MMKKTALLNSSLSELIASLGHTDMVVIADAGLPIPPGPQRIDLALTQGVPGFVETLQVILTEMQVERVIVAAEMSQHSPQVLEAVRSALPVLRPELVTHDRLKELCREARAVVRTGEFTPYANVILCAGVVF
jgi:D-ribose pyranase